MGINKISSYAVQPISPIYPISQDANTQKDSQGRKDQSNKGKSPKRDSLEGHIDILA